MVDGVGHTGVLGDALVLEVDLAVVVYGHVLKQCVASDGVEDVGLRLLVEVDHLGVAAALEVEHAVVVPAVLVVADEQTLRVGRESGLAGSREAEEDGCVLTLLVGVGRAVHRGDALLGQVVVHHREHAFLHLAAIPGVDDHLLARSGVEHDSGFAVQAEFLEVGHLGLRCVEHYEVGLEVGKFLSRGLDEHIGHEVSLPCHFNDEAHSHAGVVVGAAEAVYHVEFLVAELVDGDLLDLLPCSFGDRLVVVGVFLGCPPYLVLGVVVKYDEFVFGRAAGIYTGHHVDGAEFGHCTFLKAFQRGISFVFEELLVGGVVDYLLDILDAILR